MLGVGPGDDDGLLGGAGQSAGVSALGVFAGLDGNEGTGSGRAQGAAVRGAENVISYISQITRATREDPSVLLGCSPRASVMLLLTSKGLAALRGRTYVIPDDVKAVAGDVLRHRIILSFEADAEGAEPDSIIHRILSAVPVP